MTLRLPTSKEWDRYFCFLQEKVVGQKHYASRSDVPLQYKANTQSKVEDSSPSPLYCIKQGLLKQQSIHSPP